MRHVQRSAAHRIASHRVAAQRSAARRQAQFQDLAAAGLSWPRTQARRACSVLSVARCGECCKNSALWHSRMSDVQMCALARPHARPNRRRGPGAWMLCLRHARQRSHSVVFGFDAVEGIRRANRGRPARPIARLPALRGFDFSSFIFWRTLHSGDRRAAAGATASRGIIIML
jgi:hypothetical protein